MEIEYSLTEEDILTLARYRLQHTPGKRNPVAFRRVWYLIGFSLLAIGLYPLVGNATLSIIFLILAAVSFLVYPVFFERRLRQRISTAYRDEKFRATLDSRILSASSEGLEEKTGLSQMNVKWEAVDRIDQLPGYIVITIQGMAMIIIPENRITSGNYLDFLQACRQFKQISDAKA